MNTLAKRFVIAAIASALIGMSLGIAMGLTGNLALAHVHAHFNLLGWVSLSLFGLFYQCVPHAASGPLPQFQFYLSVLGSNLMAPALAIPLLGYSSLQSALAVPGSLSIAGMLCFAAVVYRVKSHEGDTLAMMPTMEERKRRGVATLQFKTAGFQSLSDRC
jgi:hypothetical protein